MNLTVKEARGNIISATTLLSNCKTIQILNEWSSCYQPHLEQSEMSIVNFAVIKWENSGAVNLKVPGATRCFHVQSFFHEFLHDSMKGFWHYHKHISKSSGFSDWLDSFLYISLLYHLAFEQLTFEHKSILFKSAVVHIFPRFTSLINTR